MTLQNIYSNGLVDVGWSVGYMLLRLAAQLIHKARVQRTTQNETKSLEEASQDATSDTPLGKHSFLPYALIPAIIALSAFT
jgi:hypothetical protein